MLIIYRNSDRKDAEIYEKVLIKRLEKEGIEYAINSKIFDPKKDLSYIIEPFSYRKAKQEWGNEVVSALQESIIYENLTTEVMVQDFINRNYSKTIRIGVIGYGKVGRKVVQELLDYGYAVNTIPSRDNVLNVRDMESFDVVFNCATSLNQEDLGRCKHVKLFLDAQGINNNSKLEPKNYISCREIGKRTLDRLIDRIKDGLHWIETRQERCD